MESHYSTVETTLHEDNMVKTYSNSMDPLRICETACAPENSQANETNVVSMMGFENHCKKVKQNVLQNKTGERRSNVDEYDNHKQMKKTDATENNYMKDSNKEIQAPDKSIQTLDTLYDTLRPISRWRIDSYGWNRYLEENDASENKAMKLLGDMILPDKDILNKMMQEKERVISPNVKREVLGSICTYIRRLSPMINDVWAAYRTKTGQPLERTDVVFVIHTSQKIEGEWDFETYQVCKDDITDTCKLENEAIYKYEQTGDHLTTEMPAIKAFIKKNARRLMQKHSNLTKISPSCVRSSGYQTRAAHMENIPCIALYVQIKGLVPFNEESFDRTITDIPFDVREGVFTLCGKPDDLHQNVKMGCKIDSGYGTEHGTVGPFVQLENYSDTYFLTSAHVALNKKQMEELKKSDDSYIYYGKTGHNIFQPPESKTVSETSSRYPLGKIVLAVYKEGNENEAGMELALVQVNKDRLPNDGSFPESGYHFSSGEILKREKLSSKSHVFKFGCISGLTEGQYVDDCTAVRAPARGNAVSVTLNNQIKIVSLDSTKPFGVHGDSGSLVFAVENGECRAVGIFEGMDEHHFMVTPIEDAIDFVGNRLSCHSNEICPSADRLQFKVIQLPFEQHAILGNQTCNMASMLTHNLEHSLDTVKSELRDTRAFFKRYVDDELDKLRIIRATQK